MAALCVGLQWWRIHDTYWAVDDFLFLGLSRMHPYGLTLLRTPLFEHFSPVLWSFFKLIEGPLGLNHGMAVAIGLAMSGAGILCLHRLLLRLTRSPGWSLVLAASYGASLIVTAILRWWITSVHANTAATFSIACMLAFVRYLEERRRRDAWLTFATLVVSLLTHEKALLVPLYLGLLWLLVYERRWSLANMWRHLRVDLVLWTGIGLVWALSLANYLLKYYHPTRRPALGVLSAYAARSVVSTFLPITAGIRLPGAGSPGVLGSVGGLVELITGLATVVAIVWTIRRSRSTARGWVFLAVTFAANLWVLGSAVLVLFPKDAYRSLQWQLELAFLFPVGVAMVVREWGAAPGQVSAAKRSAGVRLRTRGRWVAAGAVVALLVPYGLLTVRSNDIVRSDFPGGDVSRPYLHALSAGLTDATRRGSRPVLLDGVMPDVFAPAWMAPFNLVSQLVSTFRLPAAIDVHARSQPIFVVEPSGVIQPYAIGSPVALDLSGPAGSSAGPEGGLCVTLGALPAGYQATPHSPPTAQTEGAATLLRFDYSAAVPVMLDVVTAGAGPTELSLGQLPLPAGEHEYDAPLKAPPAGDALAFGISGGAGHPFCVENPVVGSPVPVTGAH